jgi:murein DD-endopeptidase MepM/ murein hydrolase activator NlpD
MVTDGFDCPVGTDAERRGDKVPGGKWIDANPYGTYYNVTPTRAAYHTGADLNLPEDRDAHAPVFAIANGVVTYARLGGGTWGKLVVIVHTLPSGQLVFSRYAHLESIGVRSGQPVQRGDEIGRIGNAEGQFPYHLHFDISLTSMLGGNPEDWPGTDEARLKRDYVDPLAFIRRNRPVDNPTPPIPAITPADMIKAAQDDMLKAASLLAQALAALTPPPTADQPPITTPTQARVSAVDGVNVRSAPTIKATKVGSLAKDAVVTVLDDIQADGYQWCRLVSGQFAGNYVAKNFLAFEVAVQADPTAVG